MERYVCPVCGMEYDKPGKCEMDGADLVKKPAGSGNHGHGKGHDSHDHHAMMMEEFKNRFVLSAILTVPILLLSPLVKNVLGIPLSFPGEKYLLLALSTAIFLLGGWPFLKGLVSETREKRPGMMTLIAIAISVAYFYSAAVVFGLEGTYFFWELATLIDIMLLGHWIEMKSVMGASRALEKLAELMPDTAHLVKDGDVVDISVKDLKAGDVVMVKPGEKVPADGVIVRGESFVNESMLTGESVPVRKKQGDTVIGGSVNGDGTIEIRVTGVGRDSYLSKVMDLVRKAQQSKSRTEKLADVAARWLTVVAIVSGAATFAYWMANGRGLAFAIERLATVMVIACPHALGLAIPLVNAVSTAKSARNGLLIRNRTAFENARRISAVLFDKTGTLTEGRFSVVSVSIVDKSHTEKRVIEMAASLERMSEHPIADAIVRRMGEIGGNYLKVEGFRVLKGEGVEGIVDGFHVRLLSPRAAERHGISSNHEGEASTSVVVVVDGKHVATIFLSDVIRDEAFSAVKKLKSRGIKCYMLTGDNRKIASHVSEKLGLDGFFAEVLPHEKQEKVMELKANGEFVAMVGDGINDAPALAAADIGIAIGSGTDVAAETADIILVNDNPEDVVTLIDFGRATYSKMIQNLLWATGYNVFAIPLAAGALMNYGISISPAIGAALMTLSTVIVAINARMLDIRRR